MWDLPRQLNVATVCKKLLGYVVILLPVCPLAHSYFSDYLIPSWYILHFTQCLLSNILLFISRDMVSLPPKSVAFLFILFLFLLSQFLIISVLRGNVTLKLALFYQGKGYLFTSLSSSFNIGIYYLIPL